MIRKISVSPKSNWQFNYSFLKKGNYEICENAIVQKQFLLAALRPLNFQGFSLPPYKSRLLLLDMTSLELRRELASTMLVFDLIRCVVECENMKQRVRYNTCGYSLRNTKLLQEEFHSVDYMINDPITRAIRNFNKHSDCYDESVSRSTFKLRIMKNFKTLFSTDW